MYLADPSGMVNRLLHNDPARVVMKFCAFESLKNNTISFWKKGCLKHGIANNYFLVVNLEKKDALNREGINGLPFFFSFKCLFFFFFFFFFSWKEGENLNDFRRQEIWMK